MILDHWYESLQLETVFEADDKLNSVCREVVKAGLMCDKFLLTFTELVGDEGMKIINAIPADAGAKEWASGMSAALEAGKASGGELMINLAGSQAAISGMSHCMELYLSLCARINILFFCQTIF